MPLRGMTVVTYSALADRSVERWIYFAMSFGFRMPNSVEPDRTGMWRFPEMAMSDLASSRVSVGERKTRSFDGVMTWATGTFHPVGSPDTQDVELRDEANHAVLRVTHHERTDSVVVHPLDCLGEQIVLAHEARRVVFGQLEHIEGCHDGRLLGRARGRVGGRLEQEGVGQEGQSGTTVPHSPSRQRAHPRRAAAEQREHRHRLCDAAARASAPYFI
eukprot:scaffold266237_cov36-Tisochrysis_lutea.AAC.1